MRLAVGLWKVKPAISRDWERDYNSVKVGAYRTADAVQAVVSVNLVEPQEFLGEPHGNMA